MKRIEGTPKQQAMLICATLLAIASGFPLAMSGKAIGALLWLGASLLALVMSITRLQALAEPTLVLTILFAASFFIPVEVVIARDQSFGIGWARCELVDLHSYFRRSKAADEKTYVIVRGCMSPTGIEPSYVVKVSIPQKK